MAVFDIELDSMLDRQKSMAIWSFLLFVLLFVHMLMDPILHWN